jgi:hypothetical protein
MGGVERDAQLGGGLTDIGSRTTGWTATKGGVTAKQKGCNNTAAAARKVLLEAAVWTALGEQKGRIVSCNSSSFGLTSGTV